MNTKDAKKILSNPAVLTFSENIFNSILVILLSSIAIGLLLHIQISNSVTPPEIISLMARHIYNTNIWVMITIAIFFVWSYITQRKALNTALKTLIIDLFALGTGAGLGYSYNSQNNEIAFVVLSVFLVLTAIFSLAFPNIAYIKTNEDSQSN